MKKNILRQETKDQSNPKDYDKKNSSANLGVVFYKKSSKNLSCRGIICIASTSGS